MKIIGLIGLMTIIMISCGSDETLPFISVISPSAMTNYVPGDTIFVMGTAADDQEILDVNILNTDLSIDLTIQADASTSIFEFTDSIILLTGLTNDTEELIITASDASNNIASTTISIVINSPILELNAVSTGDTIFSPGDTILFIGVARDDIDIVSLSIESLALANTYINFDISELEYELEEHVVISLDISAGSYTFIVSVTDDLGNVAVEEIILPVEL